MKFIKLELKYIIFIILIMLTFSYENAYTGQISNNPYAYQFDYTGGVQTWFVPPGVYKVKIECWGSQGGSSYIAGGSPRTGGNGGYASGEFNVIPGESYYVYVGGRSGWNGGGSGTTNYDEGGSGGSGGKGGGATDVRTKNTAWNDSTGLNSRFIVAGGGGGASGAVGYAGGGYTGGGGSGSAGGGGTQTSGGAGGYFSPNWWYASPGGFGYGGGGGGSTVSGGGGGGWYGGGGAVGNGGGGGSSYIINTASNRSTTSGVQSGDGKVLITAIPVPPTTPTITASPTTPTNGNVTVTITYSGDSTTKQYRIDRGTWQNYTVPLSITNNCKIEAQASNLVDSSSIELLNISNIDKTAPATPTLSSSPGTQTDGVVTVTVTYPGDGSVKQYKIGASGSWTSYTAPIFVTMNDTIYARCQDAAGNWSGNGSITINNIVEKTPNAPMISQGMTPIKWNGSAWVDTTTGDVQWYDYSATTNKWANIRLADGSMFVWVPRYTYKIVTGEHTSTAGIIDIKYSNGTTDDTSGGYRKHPAFTFGSDELTGIWVAKFEASDDGTGKVQIKPGITSWRSIKVNDIFNKCREMQTANSSKYGISTNISVIDTHMMKNSEWGAAAYITHWVRNNTEVQVNNNSSYYTGGGSGTAYTLNTNQSTTGNVYGIYDMSGGAWEYVAAYYNVDGGTSARNNGATIVDAEERYKDKLTVYGAAGSVDGTAVYETSSNTGGSYSWFGDYAHFVNTSYPWLSRGGNAGFGNNAGLFAFCIDDGNSFSDSSFRPSIVVIPQPPTMPTLSASPTTPTNANVTVTISYSGDSTTKQYRIDGGAWQNYTSPLTITTNCKIEAQALNLVGPSDKGILDITNIDKTPPVVTATSLIINKKVDGTGSTYASTSPLKLNINTSGATWMFISTNNTTPSKDSAAVDNISSGWIGYSPTYYLDYEGSDGPINLYAWFMDDAGNISSVATDDIIYDSTPPSGQLKINQNSSNTSDSKVILYFTKTFEYANVNEVIISKNGSFTDIPPIKWSDLAQIDSNNAYFENLELDISTAGSKKIYAKYTDWAGNTSQAFSDEIIYVKPRQITEVYSKVAHNQVFTFPQEIEFIDPYTPAEKGKISDYESINNLIFNNEYPKYRIKLDVPKADIIKEVQIDLRLNTYNEEGISINIDDMILKKYIYNNTTFKYDYVSSQSLSGAYEKLGINRYRLKLLNDTGSVFSSPGQYVFEYRGKITVPSRINRYDDATVIIVNECTISTKIKGRTINIIEPDRPTHKTYINTRVFRPDILVQ